ncbi:MAG: HAMP domain-containing histidine kinase [Solirubrobacterales bacterium]|nr:HAMP domain-containing histidine kinase [Solirubrobacterales bacterium]
MRAPAPTVRLRLAVLYGLVFLVSGAVLLTIGYLLVRHSIGGVHVRQQLDRFVPLPRVRPLGIAAARFALARQLHDQLVSAALHRLLIEYSLALGLMTVVSIGAGWLLAGRALRPLRDITATARRVSGENLGERIDLAGPADELKELADTFDGMLERLDAAFASQRHFVANASHELRTPLAIMRTEIDVALADRNAGAVELRAMGEALRETVDRCERLIESLLMLARSEGASGAEEAVDLGALAADCVTDLHRMAVVADVEIETELQRAPANGEPHLLERAIANLIDNGIRHNVRGGYLRVSSGTENGRAWIAVRNGGPVIEPAQTRTLTEPFARLDRSRGGFGLGLSIVRSVAEAHGGSSEIVAPASGGLEVRLELPRAGDNASVNGPRSTATLTQS